MELSTRTLWAIIIALGIALASTITYYETHCPKNDETGGASSGIDNTGISLEQAQQYFKGYFTNPDTLKGFLIRADFLSALDSINKADAGIHSFQFYFGFDTVAKQNLIMAVGVDDRGMEMYGPDPSKPDNHIYAITTSKFPGTASPPVDQGTCPLVCIVDSKISQ